MRWLEPAVVSRRADMTAVQVNDEDGEHRQERGWAGSGLFGWSTEMYDAVLSNVVVCSARLRARVSRRLSVLSRLSSPQRYRRKGECRAGSGSCHAVSSDPKVR